MILRKVNLICRVSISLLFLYYVFVYFQWTDSPEVRYRKYYRAMYDMIYNETGAISLAEIGSSRAQTMIGANELHKEIYGAGTNEVVYNLATSQRGKGFHYVVLRDLFEEREVSDVLLHFINTDARSDFEVHPWFYIVAKNSDVFESMFLRKHVPWYKKLTHGGAVFFKKHSSIIEDYMLGKLALAKAKDKPVPAMTRDHLSANPIRPNSLQVVMRKSIQDIIAAGENWNLSDPLEHRNNFYTNRILQLARKNGAKINFFYIPRLMEPTLAEETIFEIQNFFKVKIFAPSPKDLTEMFPAAYADAGHGSNQGRRIYAKFLARKLIAKNTNRNDQKPL